MTLNSVTVGDITIAGQQAQPPAGHDDIAFRPACDQIASTLADSGMVQHAVNLPDGTARVLATYEQMPIEKAYLFLDAEGLCKVGPDAVTVPIIYSDQVPEQSVASATASATDAGAASAVTPSSGGMGGVVTGAIALAVVGAGFYLFTQRRNSTPKNKPTEKPQPKSGTGASDLMKW